MNVWAFPWLISVATCWWHSKLSGHFFPVWSLADVLLIICFGVILASWCHNVKGMLRRTVTTLIVIAWRNELFIRGHYTQDGYFAVHLLVRVCVCTCSRAGCIAGLWRPLRVAGETAGEKPGTPGKDSRPGKAPFAEAWRPLLNLEYIIQNSHYC